MSGILHGATRGHHDDARARMAGACAAAAGPRDPHDVAARGRARTARPHHDDGRPVEHLEHHLGRTHDRRRPGQSLRRQHLLSASPRAGLFRSQHRAPGWRPRRPGGSRGTRSRRTTSSCSSRSRPRPSACGCSRGGCPAIRPRPAPPRSCSRSARISCHTAHIQLLMAGGIPLALLMLHRLADAPSPRRGYRARPRAGGAGAGLCLLRDLRRD